MIVEERALAQRTFEYLQVSVDVIVINDIHQLGCVVTSISIGESPSKAACCLS